MNLGQFIRQQRLKKGYTMDQLAKLEKQPVKKDVKKLKDLTNIEWKTMYYGLTRENKQAFWRNIIDKIEIDPSNYKKGKDYIRLYFL